MIATTSTAQITYTNWRLNINEGKPHTYFDLRINEWSGLYWTCKNDANFFAIDVSPANPRIFGTGDKIVFYNSEESRFNSIQVAEVYNLSDSRSKQDINTLNSGLTSILGLRPVSYKWKQAVGNEFDAKQKASDAAGSDSTTVAYGPAGETRLQYGFLAQEVEQVLPEVVATDETGNKMVNYIALIPMLVQSVQELQQTVEAQALTIAQLSGPQPMAAQAESACKILSCTPNPTTGFVTIETLLEGASENATIVITSMAGNREKLLTVTSAEPKVTTDVSSLQAGIHLVSLYVGNRIADSCRLIKH